MAILRTVSDVDRAALYVRAISSVLNLFASRARSGCPGSARREWPIYDGKIRVVQPIYEAFSAGDIAGVIALQAEDTVWDHSGPPNHD